MKIYFTLLKNLALPLKIISCAMGFGGAVFFILFIPAFFTRNINTGTIFGTAIGIFTAGIGFAMPYCIKAANRAVRYIYRTVLAVFCLLALYAAVLSALMLSAMNNAPVDETDGSRTVIVLGCQVRADGPSLMLKNRLEAARAYLDENPDAECIVSGGKGDNEHISEAQAMYDWLVENGIDKSRITKEDKSCSTLENLIFSKELLNEQGKSGDVILVTDGFHQFRAGLQAKQVGLSAKAISSQTPFYLLHIYWVREWLAISYQLVFGADMQ